MRGIAPTLADSLELVLDDVPTELVAARLRPDLLDLARRLAPVGRGGFEVRLGRSTEVDFQQAVFAGDGEPGVLSAHQASSVAETTPWRQLGAFLAGWEDESHLRRGIEELWLEFDRPPAGALSVFLGFARTPLPIDRRLLARSALDLLAGRPAWGRFEAALGDCFEACPPRALISHIGLMLGRPGPFLRVNVKRLGPDQLAGYLRAVGWEGALDEAVDLGHELRAMVDGLTICLDVGERVHARLGFECHLDRQPASEPRWRSLLDALVARGWCTPEKADALLDWPGVISPRDADRSWPANLVRESLRRPTDHFTIFDRRLSHMKVVLSPGSAIEAKGYFGFEHKWLRVGLDPDESRPAAAAHRRRGDAITDVTAAAIEFLLACRTRAGWWRDFSGTEGAHEEWSSAFGWSDEWVTACIAAILAGTLDARARQASRHAWELLADRRPPVGGWANNRTAPVDGDSTGMGLRLALVIGASETAVARAARSELERRRLPDGGIACYLEAECTHFRQACLAPPDGSYAGWCATSHACVVSTTASLGDEPAREFLRGAQRGDGSWAAYWWQDDGYATAQSAEALAATGRPDDRSRVAAAVRWTIARIGGDGGVFGSPFATAWALRTLLVADRCVETRERRRRAIAWLMERQEPDGGWPASAWLLVPRPDVTDRSRSPVPPMTCLDEARTFTTATVLCALTRAGVA